MSSPLETNSFRFFLNFTSNESFGLVEITEPIGFDAQKFIVTQDNDRYGRDVEYASTDIRLRFSKDVIGQPSETPTTLPTGDEVYYLTSGFDFLLYEDELNGFESDVQFILRKDNLNFIVGNIDFAIRETDNRTFFEAIVIPDSRKFILKNRANIDVNILGDKNLDNETVDVVETEKMLLKSLAVFQGSLWRQNTPISRTDFLYARGVLHYPLGEVIEKSDIKSTLVVFMPFESTESGTEDVIRFRNRAKILDTQTQLTETTVTIKNFSCSIFSVTATVPMIITLSVNYGPTLENATTTRHKFFEVVTGSGYAIENQDFTFQIPEIPAGYKLFIDLSVENIYTQSLGEVYTEMSYDLVEITTTSTELDSVVRFVRHIDVMKSVANRVSGHSVLAPKYDLGGMFYDNVVLNGYLMRQFTDREFTMSFDDMVEQLKELNADYQILPDNKVFIGQYDDFYPPIEIGAFRQHADSEFLIEYNDRYKSNTFNYSYEEFEQDEDGTLEAVHTQAQFVIPNKQVENDINVEVPWVRDPYKIESTRRKNFISNNSTSITADQTAFIIDIIALPEDTTRTIKNILNFSFLIGTNRTFRVIAGDNFGWDLLGFGIGDRIESIRFMLNSESYDLAGVVIGLERSLLTIELDSRPTSIAGGQYEEFIEITYPLANVNWQNRTDEGFDFIGNISRPDTYSNLAYTIRRNMRYWESYIKTSGSYILDKVFKNTMFKSNGEASTKLIEEDRPIIENRDVIIDSLRERILTPRVINTNIIASFQEAVNIITSLNTVYENGTIGGFIRVVDTNDRVLKGYVRSLEYDWGKEEMSLVLEEKYEEDIIKIRSMENGLIFINNIGYDDVITKPINYKTVGDYITLYDSQWLPINNPQHISKYEINGNSFDNIDYLCHELSLL